MREEGDVVTAHGLDHTRRVSYTPREAYENEWRSYGCH
jgi:hypothetical protein